MPRGHIKFYGKGGSINFGEDLLDWKSEVLVPFLRVKGIKGQLTTPPPPHVVFFRNASDRNFEIAISSKIVQR